jgi:lipopolysaccharide transport system ATP-binding protein
MGTVIKVDNISKLYRLGEIGTGTFSQDLERFYKTKILRREDPFSIIGETNDRSSKGVSEIVYSLRDISFEISKGDAIGIIGNNGAGKSTLLKILSRVTSPSTGTIKINGRIASLLEVGTGFHPELTGRENVFLNGAILGMKKNEILKKFDEIIDFSGVERYIDTPVKRYSSGMYVRLAFAVAAYLESEILIVDEVLAVGDAEFQKKCLGKMDEVSSKEGKTILFVSHNIQAVNNLCKTSILLNNGRINKIGKTKDVLYSYLNGDKKEHLNNKYIFNEVRETYDYYINTFIINPEKTLLIFLTSESIVINIQLAQVRLNSSVIFCLKVLRDSGEKVFSIYEKIAERFNFDSEGKIDFKMVLPDNLLPAGNYYIDIDTHIPGQSVMHHVESISSFSVVDNMSKYSIYPNSNNGVVLPNYTIIA